MGKGLMPSPLHTLFDDTGNSRPFMKGRDDMNIFQNRDSLFGCLDSEVVSDSLLSLFRLAKQIRLRLGKQGYLLDNYLSHIFMGLDRGLASNAAEEGNDVSSTFQRLFFHLLDGTEPSKPHPLYPRMREVYEQHADKLAFQERYTNLCQLMFPLADELMAYATAEFVKEQDNNLNGVVDGVYLRELYDKISHLAGEAMMEELNQKIKQRFLIAPQAVAFAQGFTDELLCKLANRDHETSRQMFQLLMDSLPSDEGV